MAQQNPIEEAMHFYQKVVDEAIEDMEVHDDSGKVRQVGNIDKMRMMIKQSPKPAQIIIQLLHQDAKNAPADVKVTIELHALWLMIAYLLEYGKFDPSSLYIKQGAPELYTKAINAIKEKGL